MSEQPLPAGNPSDQAKEFTDILERIHAGDKEAATALFLLFGPSLRGFFRNRLRKFRKLQTLHDSEDFVQTMWQSLLSRNLEQKPRIGFAHLKTYLFGIAGNTFRQIARAECRQKRDIRHTQHGTIDEDTSGRVFAAPVPNPWEIREAEEAWVMLTQCVPHLQQRILTLLRDGFTHAEVAQEMGVSERTGRRVVVLKATSA